MPLSPKHRRRAAAGAALLSALALSGGLASPSVAAAPSLGEAWASEVFTASARLSAEINPNNTLTTYHFDYITQTAYEANLSAAKEPFAGALRAPAGSDASAGTVPKTVQQLLFNLGVDTAYRYRVVAKSSEGTATGLTQGFATQPLAGTSVLPDNRGWEMVSPVDKNGGQVDPPGALAGGGDLQAAAGGGAVTYGSAASFAGGQGAPPASQYLSTRTTSGWQTQNLTAPLFSGSYDTAAGGVPYRLFSEGLDRALLLNGHHCRGEAIGCAVANPPLAGTDAPAGYQNFYLREGGSYAALLGPTEISQLALSPAQFEVSLAGAAPDLGHLVLESCGALSASAGDGCGTDQSNLYEFSQGAGLSLVNTTPGAALAAPAGAISTDGSRVYWKDLGDANLYLREGAQLKQVDQDAGGGGSFQAASADGSIAYFSKSAHLYRYSASADAATDLTPSGGVTGVLGASADGAAVYYQDAGGLKLRQGATTTTIAPGAGASDASDYPPSTGTTRVSADGTKLLFVATAPLTGYDNTDLNTKAPDPEIYLYDSGSGLACLSCNPTGERPIGPSTIPGALENGDTAAYKPRVLTDSGRRAFFESSDALASTDTNNDTDVYQWEAPGEGSCTRAGGCIGLISSGRASEGASFLDASSDGSDAFFLTDGSLVEADPGSVDLYDARIGGGFPTPPVPIPCQGDACQALPPEPVDPTLTTVLAGPGNPKVRYSKYGQKKKCQRASGKRGGKCAKGAKRGKGKKRGGGAR